MKTIALTQGFVATVDDEDFVWLCQWKWHASKSAHNYYAARFSGAKPRHKIYMHREIARRKYSDHGETLNGQQVDHDDGDTMNNTRANMIARTQQENLAKRGGRFAAAATRDGDDIPF